MESGGHDPRIVGRPPGDTGDVWRGHWADEADTAAFAQRLAACPAIVHATLTLQGDLGAGKTTFVRHLLRALGVRGRIKSPTYAVVEPHSTSDCPLMPEGEVLCVWHFDFYRFTDPREWEDAGFRELFASAGLKLVEWPERAAGVMPPVDAELHIEPSPMQTLPEHDAARDVRLTAFTPAGRRLLACLTP
ncbi:MAG: tRNA (adenosine(37)-N6)-threonylcarbamoyltransferase complex ATPase subunit type 1 TsaE [Hydrogenophaga sp.]